MTTKEAFLKQFLDKIKANEVENKTLREAYEYNSKLPDSFFEFLNNSEYFSALKTYSLRKLSYSVNDDNTKVKENNEVIGEKKTEKNEEGDKENEYGRNKKLIVQILHDTSKVMLKSEIVKKFETLTNEDEETSLGQVTNALAALSHENSVIGYKPEKGVKFRGKYWGLYNWYKEDGELMDEYKPPQRRLLHSYLN